MDVAVGSGQPSADLIGLGDAESGVDGKRLLPLVAGLAGIASWVAGAGKAMVGASLLVPVADLPRQAESRRVLGAGVAWQPDGQEQVTQAVASLCLAGPVADLPMQFECLLMVPGGLLVAA